MEMFSSQEHEMKPVCTQSTGDIPLWVRNARTSEETVNTLKRTSAKYIYLSLPFAQIPLASCCFLASISNILTASNHRHALYDSIHVFGNRYGRKQEAKTS